MQKIFSNCFKITSNTTFCWLQYKILHMILPFKSYLQKIGVTDYDKINVLFVENSGKI